MRPRAGRGGANLGDLRRNNCRNRGRIWRKTMKPAILSHVQALRGFIERNKPGAALYLFQLRRALDVERAGEGASNGLS